MAYVDSVTDSGGADWFINDVVSHVLPGVRTDAGTIAQINGAYRVTVNFEDGGRFVVPFAELVLIRRRTRDEIPYASGLV